MASYYTNRVAWLVPPCMLVLAGVGCRSAPRITVQTDRYRLEVRLDPVSHRIEGRAVLDLRRKVRRGDEDQRSVGVELLLHPDLRITEFATGGVEGRYRGVLWEKHKDDEFHPRRHLVVLEEPPDSFAFFIKYEGKLFQDPDAGEVPGQIHNFEMRAHIGEEGIYLAGGHWYPMPATEDDAPPVLSEYTLLAKPVTGLELQAGADYDETLARQTGGYAWRSPYPLEKMVLVGGPHEVHRSTHNGINIQLHLKPDQAEHAAGLAESVRNYLDRYEPLIGPYPAADFAVVDNFFSSGFAFPTFTLLASAVIDMGARSQTVHGYIDHEVLHSWWGNGVHVDSRDGNWCEALASYGANYYGHVLDGEPEEARRRRRNYVHFLSRLEPDKDKPLGTYGLDDGCGRGIAYSKGAMVFHMLARTIGQDTFWAVMRRFTHEYVGKYASWTDIQRLAEEESGQSLDTFFRQWVRWGGAPTLTIESAEYDSAAAQLLLSISQGKPAFELEVPLRVTHAGGEVDLSVAIDAPTQDVVLPLDVVPQSVELDPDYHLFRKVALDDIVPTTARTRYGDAFVSVLPPNADGGPLESLRDLFESKFEESERIRRVARQIEEGALANRGALIVGDAVHDSYVSGFLMAVNFPVRFDEYGFEFGGERYDDPAHAVLCTIAHPGVTGGGITVVYANDPSAMPPAINMLMYDRSLIVFDDKKPIRREDFERRVVVPVEQR